MRNETGLCLTGLAYENGWCNVPALLTLNNELRSALADMLLPRERLFLNRAIGKGSLHVFYPLNRSINNARAILQYSFTKITLRHYAILVWCNINVNFAIHQRWRETT